MDRDQLREIQDRAIKAIELLFPDCTNLEAWNVAAGCPTVGEARQNLFPHCDWIWRYWIEEGKKAGHNI